MPPQTKSRAKKGVAGANAKESCTPQATSAEETILGGAPEEESQLPGTGLPAPTNQEKPASSYSASLAPSTGQA